MLTNELANLGVTEDDASIIITSAQLVGVVGAASIFDNNDDLLVVDSITLADTTSGIIVNNLDATWAFTPAENLTDRNVVINYTITGGESTINGSITFYLTPINDS